MTDTINGRDAYFRVDDGAVQHARVWDMETWLARHSTQVIDGKPVKFTLAEEAEYRFERGWA